MRKSSAVTRFTAVCLAILISCTTGPVWAADTAARIGSVSIVGAGQLREISTNEGTLFSGDRLRVDAGSYARVVLAAGQKLEVGGGSDVVLSRDGDVVDVQMSSGNVAFTNEGQNPLRVRIGGHEIRANGSTKGTVAFVGSQAFGVRALSGDVTLRNAAGQSFTIRKGTERMVSVNAPGAPVRLASAVPASIPAAPAVPRQSMSPGLKTALIVASVLGTVGAIVLLATKNDDTDSGAANRLAATQALTNTAALSTTAGAARSAATSVSSATADAVTRINGSTLSAANRTNFSNQATAIGNRATAANTAIAAIQQQIATLEAAINASGTVTPAQANTINSLINQLESQRLVMNQVIADLLALVALVNQTAGTTLVPTPNIQPIAQSAAASQTLP